ncbi:ABC transporter permease [Bacillus sp. DJP31]|uniref:ABC transporter permease n=1 Tax=Bacillus sp. DJP31 TaxID=3409789 RepID=UPI003BB591E2
MLRFIWNSWWRNKERLILLIIGVLIISTGLSYLVGITQATDGTITDELQKRWESSYHIVVRSDGSRSVTEDKKLLEPNYLSGLEGGITLEQYEKIKSIDDIDVAAPISMMGYVYNSVQLDKLNITKPGVYRLKITEETNTGVDTYTSTGNLYFTKGGWQPEGTGKEYGISQFEGELGFGSEVMLAGIDPEQESSLIGIDGAMVESKNSRFFTNEDEASVKEEDGQTDTQIPVIISNQEFVDGNITFSVEKLDLPFEPAEQGETMEKVKQNGGMEYLEKQNGKDIEKRVFTTEQAHKKIISQLSKGSSEGLDAFHWMAYKPSPVTYRPVSSPYPERWPFSYEVQPYKIPEDSLLAVDHSYRPVHLFSEDSSGWKRLQFDFKGIFDPRKLNISKDPLTELPMETYFPSKAQWVIDKENQPVNPPTDMKPLNNPYGFLTKPPLILTTIDAAAKVLGDKPISAIRVKVSGVEKLTDESEQILQQVAERIENETGLITDITLGSSPQPALTHIPGIEGKENLGWVQQPWIKLGSSITIFQETKVGFSGIIASVILVAIVYVFSSNLIMMFSRKKEFAVLLSLGWRPSKLSKLLFIESTILGLTVSSISWLILGFFYLTNDIDTSVRRILLIGVFGIVIYWLGMIIPALLVKRIKPYEAMKQGEISRQYKRITRAQSIVGMTFNYLVTMWKRTALSIVSIAFPTSLLIFFLFITFRLRGIMYATWLGEFVAMEVGTMHYIAMGVAILIAILTTAEIIWQNVSERQSEIAVLKALGWQNKNIRLLVLLEGGISGFLAGLVGLGLAFIIIWSMYGEIPSGEMLFLFGTLLIPILTGVLAAILPAEKAVKIQPYQGLQGTISNSKGTEKRFKYAFGVAGAGLTVAILTLLFLSLPDTEGSQMASTLAPTNQEGTVGEVTEAFKDTKVNEESTKSEGSDNIIEQYLESAWVDSKLGERIDLNKDGSEVFSFGDLTAPPADITKEDDNSELLTIPLTFERMQIDDKPNGSIFYKPYFRVVDEKGIEYRPKDMKIVGRENWDKSFNLRAPGKAEALLTYEVSKKFKAFNTGNGC